MFAFCVVYSLFMGYGFCILMWEGRRSSLFYGQWNRGGCSCTLQQEGPGRNMGAALAGVNGGSVQSWRNLPVSHGRVSCPEVGETDGKGRREQRECFPKISDDPNML